VKLPPIKKIGSAGSDWVRCRDVEDVLTKNQGLKVYVGLLLLAESSGSKKESGSREKHQQDEKTPDPG